MGRGGGDLCGLARLTLLYPPISTYGGGDGTWNRHLACEGLASSGPEPPQSEPEALNRWCQGSSPERNLGRWLCDQRVRVLGLACGDRRRSGPEVTSQKRSPGLSGQNWARLSVREEVRCLEYERSGSWVKSSPEQRGREVGKGAIQESVGQTPSLAGPSVAEGLRDPTARWKACMREEKANTVACLQTAGQRCRHGHRGDTSSASCTKCGHSPGLAPKP